MRLYYYFYFVGCRKLIKDKCATNQSYTQNMSEPNLESKIITLGKFPKSSVVCYCIIEKSFWDNCNK